MVSNFEKHTTPEAARDAVQSPTGQRATSYDVARRAGVSQSAVSRCFKPGASVSSQMRERVMAAAEELEYQPNAIARGLITRRSNLIAVLVSSRLSLYYPEVLFRITEHLSACGLRALLFAVENEADAGSVVEQIWQYQVDGVISASHLSIAQYQLISKRNIPVVMFNRFFSNYATNVVHCDPAQQIDELVQRLVALGHARFGLVRGPEQNMVSRERCRKVCDALQRFGAASLVEAEGDFSYESGAVGLQTVLTRPHAPTAIVCANDMMALGAIDEARLVLDLDVPGDLSFVSFDGIGMAQFASYELTTIRQPIGRMAEAAVKILRDRIETPGHSNERCVFEGSIIDGSTIGAARL
jgi:DNA-binding LacI/PurR family transcriptional regulator